MTSPRIFQEQAVPSGSELAGYSWLAARFDLAAPARTLSCIAARHVRGQRTRQDNWTIFDKRYRPAPTTGAHLEFALRYEGVDLLLLKKAFGAIEPDEIAGLVRSSPTGAYARRLWFLKEWLTGDRLDLPDASTGSYIDALDPKLYFTAAGRNSPRHRVRDNLPGNRGFCGLVRRTPTLERFIGRKLDERAKALTGRIDPGALARAASFILLADSLASFEIEGIRPPRGRVERWGRAVLQAGRRKLTTDELVRLQAIVIEDDRFVHRGWRPDGVFLGTRDPADETPIPEFIGARPQDLPALVDGLIAANEAMARGGIDPVLQAAIVAFGFVFIHPFEDGNGRIHRCLVHHALAERGFSPPGVVFPVSSVMLRRPEEYRSVLVRHSGALMPFVEWRPMPNRNVEVTNDTADLYRFFDATPLAEFLYECVESTIEHDLPQEIEYLQRHDAAKRRIQDMIDMPDRTIDDFIMFARQNGGRLAKKRRRAEFARLTDDEVAALERIYQEAFDGHAGRAARGRG